MESYQIVVKSKAPFLQEAACVWIIKKFVDGYEHAKVVFDDDNRDKNATSFSVSESPSHGNSLTSLIVKYVPEMFKAELQPLFYYLMTVGKKAEDKQFARPALVGADLAAFKTASLYWLAQGAVCKYRNRLRALNAMIYLIDLSATAIIETVLLQDVRYGNSGRELVLGRIIELNVKETETAMLYRKLWFACGYAVLISKERYRGVVNIRVDRGIKLRMNDSQILMTIAKYEDCGLWRYYERSNVLYYDPKTNGADCESKVDFDDLAITLNSLF